MAISLGVYPTSRHTPLGFTDVLNGRDGKHHTARSMEVSLGTVNLRTLKITGLNSIYSIMAVHQNSSCEGLLDSGSVGNLFQVQTSADDGPFLGYRSQRTMNHGQNWDLTMNKCLTRVFFSEKWCCDYNHM